MGTICASLVADLFLYCFERNFMKSLLPENQGDIIEAFNSTSTYLDDLLNIDNIYFEQMVNGIFPDELQLNKSNSSDTDAPFLDLNLFISNGTVSTKVYDKRDNFDFDIVNIPFHDGDVPRRKSYGVKLDNGPDIKLFILVGLGRSFFVCCLAHRGSTVGFPLLQCSSGVVRYPRDLQVSVATRSCRVLIFASS